MYKPPHFCFFELVLSPKGNSHPIEGAVVGFILNVAEGDDPIKAGVMKRLGGGEGDLIQPLGSLKVISLHVQVS